MRRKTKALLALAAFSVVGLALVVIAQAPPPIPATHPIPIDPEADAATCFQCHQSVDPPPPSEVSFCTTCHFNLHIRFATDQPVVREAPRPPHPVNLNWTAADCFNCHRQQHNGANPTHQIREGMPNASFCVTCHVAGEIKITGNEVVGDFCARCHNLGVVPEHPTGEGQLAEFCLSCHTQE